MHINHKTMYELCKQYMHSYVHAELSDGRHIDGIITGLDDEYVYFAVPNIYGEGDTNEISNPYEDRQFGYPGYRYFPPMYGYPRPRPFSRVIIPLVALTALTLLPWY